MCTLCSQLLNEIHWSDRQLNPELVTRGAAETSRRQDRYRRIRLVGEVLTHYRLDVADDWGSTNYVIGNRKGKRQVVTSLAELWQAAERMAGRRLDPLDDALLEHLSDRKPQE
jgi:hypothetical protein